MSNASYKACGNARESTEHVLRGCPKAQEVRMSLAWQGLDYLSYDGRLNEWIRDNIEQNYKDPNWSTKFLTTIGYIWKWLNALCFEDSNES